eukprot:9061020-Heterocapsa_arctica.AAC.1
MAWLREELEDAGRQRKHREADDAKTKRRRFDPSLAPSCPEPTMRVSVRTLSGRACEIIAQRAR